MKGIRPGIRRLFRHEPATNRAAETDADDELRSFLEERVDYLVARGLSLEEAQRQAEAKLGESLGDARSRLRRSARQRMRTQDMKERIGNILRDAQYAVRTLRRDALMTTFVVLTLALGIGANAAIFGVADRLLLRGPEHVRDADRVVRLYSTARNRGGESETNASFGYVTYAVLAKEARSLDGVAAYQISQGTLGQGARAQNVTVGRATASFFPLLGVHPALGRFFSAEEDATATPQRVTVISDALWQREFGARRTALGAQILLSGELYTIVGVAPRGFTGVTLSPVDAWIPVSLIGRALGPDWTTAWYWTSLRVVARLGTTVLPAEAGQNATGVLRAAYPDQDPMIREAKWEFLPLAFNDEGKEPAELSIARWLVAVSVIVLLVACANVINLLLARSFRRQREISIRVALGAGRARLVRLLLIEGLLLASVGGICGLAVAYSLGEIIRAVLLPHVEWVHSPVDLRVLAVTASVALSVGIVIGLFPALRATRPDLVDALKATVHIGGGRRSRMRTALTLAQASLSVVLLVGAGLFVRSVRNVNALDLGVAADRVLIVGLSPSESASESAGDRQARRKAFGFRVLERVRRLPEMEHATFSIGVPFGSYNGVSLRIPGRDSLPALAGGGPRVLAVADDYFATVGTRILRGRAFTPADHGDGERVMIVSDRLARAYWPGEEALGKCMIMMKTNNPCARVVGIAANTYTRDIGEEPGLQFYVPFEQAPFAGFSTATLIVRPRGDPTAAVAPLRRALLGVDSALAYLDIKTLHQGLDPQLRPWRLGTVIFGLFGVLAVLIAAAGLYAVVSYTVTTRVHEIGVRIALGATSGNVLRLIVQQAVVLTSVGTLLGMFAARIAGRFIEPLLFRTSANDPAVYGLVAAVLLTTALAAAIVPAARASRVSAVEALRYE